MSDYKDILIMSVGFVEDKLMIVRLIKIKTIAMVVSLNKMTGYMKIRILEITGII